MATIPNLSEALTQFYTHHESREGSFTHSQQIKEPVRNASKSPYDRRRHSPDTWKEIYRCPAPDEIDLLCLEQACHDVVFTMEYEVAVAAHQRAVPEDIVFDMVVDRFLSRALGFQPLPPSHFTIGRKNEEPPLTKKQLSSTDRQRERVEAARLEHLRSLRKS